MAHAPFFFTTPPGTYTDHKTTNTFLNANVSAASEFFLFPQKNCNNSPMCGVIFQIYLFYFCTGLFAFNGKNAHRCPSTAIYLVMEENGDIQSPSDWGEPSPVHVCDGKGNWMPYLDILSVKVENQPLLFSVTSMVYFKAVKWSRGSFPTSFKSSCRWIEVGNGCGALGKDQHICPLKVKSGTYCVPKSSAGGWKCRGHPFSREYGEELEVTREYLNWVHTDVYWKDGRNLGLKCWKISLIIPQD